MKKIDLEPTFLQKNMKFICSYMALGADRLAFAVDAPFKDYKQAVQFVDSFPISDSDKDKIYYQNAEKLFGLT
jgi:predicted TIM-barrel fold metal-dependent hydrolase